MDLQMRKIHAIYSNSGNSKKKSIRLFSYVEFLIEQYLKKKKQNKGEYYVVGIIFFLSLFLFRKFEVNIFVCKNVVSVWNDTEEKLVCCFVLSGWH